MMGKTDFNKIHEKRIDSMRKMYEVPLEGKKELFHGIVSLKKTPYGVVPSRMTDRLLDFYRSRGGEPRLIRAQGSAGVRLQFRTKAERMALRIKFGPFIRNHFGFDISCDSVPVKRLIEKTAMEDFSFETELPGNGLRTVIVSFPWQTECTVMSLQLDDVSVVEPVANPGPPIVMLGDSITQGYEVSAPEESYAARTAAGLGREWINLAVGGMTMRGEGTEAALDYPWDTALLAYGVNDCAGRVPLDEFRQETMRSLKALCGRSGAKIFMIAPLPWPGCPADHPADRSLQKYREILAECAGKFPQAALVDGTILLENDPRFFAEDMIHPNAQGMKRIADRLIPLIRAQF